MVDLNSQVSRLATCPGIHLQTRLRQADALLSIGAEQKKERGQGTGRTWKEKTSKKATDAFTVAAGRDSALQKEKAGATAGLFVLERAGFNPGSLRTSLQVTVTSPHRQRHAPAVQPLVHTRDLAPKLASGIVDFSGGVGRIISAIAVGTRRAQLAVQQKRAGGKFEFADAEFLAGIAQLGIAGLVAKYLDDLTLVGHTDHRIALVDRHPDTAVTVENDAIRAFQQGMSDEETIHAERLGRERERRIATGPAAQISATVELHFPDGAASGVGDEEIAVLIEGQAVGDQWLGIRGRRWRLCWLQGAILPAYANAIRHRLDTEDFLAPRKA